MRLPTGLSRLGCPRSVQTAARRSVRGVLLDGSRKRRAILCAAGVLRCWHALSRIDFRLVAESGRLGRTQLLAKRGFTGQMQILAELVPIPDTSRYFRMRPGCVGILNSGKFLRILAKFRQLLHNMFSFSPSFFSVQTSEKKLSKI